MMKRVPFLIVAILSTMPGSLSSKAEELTPEGVGLHDNKRIRVKVAPCEPRHDEPLCGKIVWLKNPDNGEGERRLDTENPDQSARNDPVAGTTVVRGLVRSGPRLSSDGASYNARVEVVGPNMLHVRAYVMLPLFGETKVWTRVGD